MNTTTTPHSNMALSKEEHAFFVQLGERLAKLRQDQGITQTELASKLGVSQQTITAYEVGRRRIQVSALPVVAQVLGVGVEDLLNTQAKPAKRGPTPKIQRQLERVSQLPRARQRMVSEVLDSLLAQSH